MDLMSWIGIGCIALAIILFIAEAVSPGFFIAIPGTVLFVLGLVALIAPDYFGWPLLFILPVVLAVAVFATLKLYHTISPPGPPETSSGGSLVGMTGVVKADVVPDSLKGKVRINNQMWSATSDNPIPSGSRVKVVGMEGVHVEVVPYREGE